MNKLVASGTVKSLRGRNLVIGQVAVGPRELESNWQRDRVDPFPTGVYARKKWCGFKGANLHKMEVVEKAFRKRCMEKANPCKRRSL